MPALEASLKATVARLERTDRRLAEELRSVRESQGTRDGMAAFLESASQAAAPAIPPQLTLETIVLRVGRPVLAIVQGAARMEFTDSESEVWRTRLRDASGHLQRAAGAVGRIDVSGHPRLSWVGTGWLVADSTILTNRHVAREFARRNGDSFTFTSNGMGGLMRPSIDFLEEIGSHDRLELRIVEIMHIEDDTGPDLALLRIEPASGAQPPGEPIPLADAAASPEQQIAVIGYPARDSRIPDYALMQSIFGDVYDKKRLAPGQIIGSQDDLLLHDCSTLGGNSGSVLVDLASGQAVGLHFAGRFLQANYAIPARRVVERLDQVRRRVKAGGHPSRIRPSNHLAQSVIAGTQPTSGATIAQHPADESDAGPFLEGVPGDYVGRAGYDATFVGIDVPLPTVTDANDVLTFQSDAAAEHVLRYQHFSVVMSRSRRMCIFSATNIDGPQSRKIKRQGWRLDPRIPRAQQLMDECYGNPPRFSRGHMTRREDPVWGEPDAAARGNSDSMHVTNTVPQMQPFNGGIWLGLEDYALDHARDDDMRISVFTGPFLLPEDPVRYSVQIPLSFWKVIAFIHDDTKALCATGYTMSQEEFLRHEEFVYGQHRTAQTTVRAIERRAGLSFGTLSAVDPFDSGEEGVATELTDFRQITFRRR